MSQTGEEFYPAYMMDQKIWGCVALETRNQWSANTKKRLEKPGKSQFFLTQGTMVRRSAVCALGRHWNLKQHAHYRNSKGPLNSTCSERNWAAITHRFLRCCLVIKPIPQLQDLASLAASRLRHPSITAAICSVATQLLNRIPQSFKPKKSLVDTCNRPCKCGLKLKTGEYISDPFV